MKKEEVDKLRFKLQTHMSCETYHTATYVTNVNGNVIRYCVKVPVDGSRKHTLTHYMINCVVYKKLKKFYEAMENI